MAQLVRLLLPTREIAPSARDWEAIRRWRWGSDHDVSVRPIGLYYSSIMIQNLDESPAVNLRRRIVCGGVLV